MCHSNAANQATFQESYTVMQYIDKVRKRLSFTKNELKDIFSAAIDDWTQLDAAKAFKTLGTCCARASDGRVQKTDLAGIRIRR